ncbi:Asp-tRNA(Asn)/Glu-tRNA(Gln) amidotransferase subunit GatB [Candidatus Dojkabacteria bacterium]|nr:Asp-tRNA(Asn)/Glu-tRNA(Gln) amidotransferase subunit GatB [Candidatus Dojkabacteria bacterium]
MSYELVLGLEIHIQSKTKSKMFCACSTDYFGKEPNTYTCPVCLGLPGALPVPNKKAIDLCMKLGLALNCSINQETKFDRKNYFYTDLPKGYQISQYDQPLCYEGHIDLEIDGENHRIGITRVHQEEDTGKSSYAGGRTFLDYNKSGVPLIEVVTEADFRSIDEVLEFANQLRLLVRYLGVSDADMEKGQMRFEPNISLRRKGYAKLPPYKVEVKNIGSISVLENVIRGEIERQSEILDKGETPVQETRGLVDMTGETVSQRAKETEADYRYFPEPDIPPIVFTKEDIENVRKELPKRSPYELRSYYLDEIGLSPKDADFFVNDLEVSSLFNKLVDGKESDKKYIDSIVSLIKTLHSVIIENSIDRNFSDLDPGFIKMVIEEPPPGHLLKELLKVKIETYWEKDLSPNEILQKEGLESVSDANELSEFADKVISANPKAVSDYKNNPNAIMFLVGQVMSQMNGKADPNIVKKILEGKLK